MAKSNQQITEAVAEMADAMRQITYTKEKILGMERYRSRRDLLSVLLKDGQSYTYEEVNKAISDFTGKAVK